MVNLFSTGRMDPGGAKLILLSRNYLVQVQIACYWLAMGERNPYHAYDEPSTMNRQKKSFQYTESGSRYCPLGPGLPDVKAPYFKLQAFKLMSYESHCRPCTPRRLSQAV